MAQETNIKPIDSSSNAPKIFMDLGDSLQRDRLAQDAMSKETLRLYSQQLKDDQKQKFDLANSIPVQAHSLFSNPQMRDDYIGAAQKFFGENKAKLDPTQLALGIGNLVKDYTNLENKHTVVGSQVENFVKDMPNKGEGQFLKKMLTDDVNKMALYKNVDGKLVPKTAEEIDENRDYVGEIMKGPDAWKYYNGAAGLDQLDKEIKEAPKVKEKKRVVDQNGLVRTIDGSFVEYNPTYQRVNPRTGNVEMKTDELGNIDDKAYSNLTSNPTMNAAFSQMANSFITHYNELKPSEREAFLKAQGVDKAEVSKGSTLPPVIDPTMPFYSTVFDQLKKSFATDYIGSHIGKTEDDIRSTTIVNNTGYGNSTTNPNATILAPVERIKRIAAGDVTLMGDPIVKDGNTYYNVTKEFETLPLYKNLLDKTYGPNDVKFFPKYPATGKPAYVVIEKVNKKGEAKEKVYTVQGFGDFVIPKTEGIGYDKPDKKKAY